MRGMKTNGAGSPPQGFTLLEVLVAVAIAGTAIVMLLHTHSASMRLYERCRGMVIAQHLIRELMSEIEVSGYPGEVDERGDLEDQYPGFRWRRTCRMMPKLGPGIYEVTVVITGPVEPYIVVALFTERGQ